LPRVRAGHGLLCRSLSVSQIRHLFSPGSLNTLLRRGCCCPGLRVIDRQHIKRKENKIKSFEGRLRPIVSDDRNQPTHPHSSPLKISRKLELAFAERCENYSHEHTKANGPKVQIDLEISIGSLGWVPSELRASPDGCKPIAEPIGLKACTQEHIFVGL